MTSSASTKTPPSKIDRARERELFKYFQPLESPRAGETSPPSSPDFQQHNSDKTLSVKAASSPDTTLTALAQLCALRLHAPRAMISVIDSEKQYFIAESTRTLDLADNAKSEVEGDGLWIGCGVVDKAGRLCEKTIELSPLAGQVPCFTVTDLSKDPRFCELPFVTGPPFFKFYAGTPLTTKRGVNIGSLFILDDQIRSPLNADQERLLGTVAEVVMKHMEVVSEAEERKKAMRMSMGLNAFVEGKSRLVFDRPVHAGTTVESQKQNTLERISSSEDRRNVAAGRTSKTGTSPHRELGKPAQGPSDKAGVFDTAMMSSDTSQDDSDQDSTARFTDTGHRMTFTRAANLLYESLDLIGKGGVVFFDTSSRFRKQEAGSSSEASRADTMETQSAKAAEVISHATGEAKSNPEGQTGKTISFTSLDEDVLQRFLVRYPRGKMWSFDGDGSISSSDDDTLSSRGRRKPERDQESRAKRRIMEALTLQTHFPGVRQLMFTGLWDAGASRYFTGGFIWTTSSRQIFSVESELNFFRAFGNSAMSEVSRLASIAADRQKADFIGSISHEFRSPLHGILASAEFLAETNMDAFQSSLVDTISSCGRTLLDTINHILDYSKINSFERNLRNVRKSGGKSRALGPNRRVTTEKETPPMMNIYATVDVAAVAEEVVEGVYAGQVYQDISSTDATDFSLGAQVEAQGRGIQISDQIRKAKVGTAKEVEVIIDIPYDDYTFITQPGALKRVIMNIFGNALKYTQKGSICVKLALKSSGTDIAKDANETVLEIKVSDTGKGISRDYLRTRLYSPFCQEDVLASGTGLGLSIVRSIVTMLRGTIDVQSEVGQGTDVTVRLPLSRVPGMETPETTPSTVTSEQHHDSSMVALSRYEATTVALYGFESEMAETGRVLKACIEDWFGLRTLSASPGAGLSPADLIVVDEKNLPMLLKQKGPDVPIAVLCSNSSRAQTASHHITTTVMELVSRPFGPHKLAKALLVCLEKGGNTESGFNPQTVLPERDMTSLDSQAQTAIPDLERLTLETDDIHKPLEVQTNSFVTASDSTNAMMAIDNNSPSNGTSGEITVTNDSEFPFPSPDNFGNEIISSDSRGIDDDYKAHLTRRDSRRPDLVSRTTEPLTKITLPAPPPATQNGQASSSTATKKDTLDSVHAISLTASNMALHDAEPNPEGVPAEPSRREECPPRLLLVDDNKINLRLLETYMRKRKYKLVDSVENGLLAVKAVESNEHGYDIVFMDISMPVMNGFEATRAIREIEEARSNNDEKEFTAYAPALIIALTGLASSRDQTEAFTSGIDLFMTKPVSFKEVGRLLDNWEAHGGLKSTDKDKEG